MYWKGRNKRTVSHNLEEASKSFIFFGSMMSIELPSRLDQMKPIVLVQKNENDRVVLSGFWIILKCSVLVMRETPLEYLANNGTLYHSSRNGR